MFFTIPCLFGLEGILAKELTRLEMQNVRAENGRVSFCGEYRDMLRANLWLRTGERVLMKIGEFKTNTFSELFDFVEALAWERFIPKNGAFPVKGFSLHSKLHSIPDCQSIIKKAMVERLKRVYDLPWMPEDGARYQIQFAIRDDITTMYIDSTGQGLHKRGYRAIAGAAPIRETLAAAMVELAKYRGREVFCDPFCGSGTILIEAALIAMNRAPGLSRRFACESWEASDKQLWRKLRDEAREKEFHKDFRLWGGDIDSEALAVARENTIKAGVSQYITLENKNALEFAPESERGTLVTNPPYGERMLELHEAENLYAAFGKVMMGYPGYNSYIISSHPEFERFYGKSAEKRRKLYNGMLKCELFMYY